MTHPFHPWCGREFVFVAVRHTWGEDRVFFFGEDGVQKSLPRAWTDAADRDVFVVLAEGRSPFRVEDLLVLASILEGLLATAGKGTCKADCAVSVNAISS